MALKMQKIRAQSERTKRESGTPPTAAEKQIKN
jgi:hypothetical protein